MTDDQTPGEGTPDGASPAGPRASDGGSDRKPGRRKRTSSRRVTTLKVLGVVVLTLAVISGVGVAFAIRHLNGNLEVVDIANRLQDRPSKIVDTTEPQEPINILVMGSDTRRGAGNKIDGESGAKASDTTILLHLSADRERAYGISIPRDSMVDRPECDRGDIPAADYVLWNEAFSVGGPACTQQQFEQLTGVYVDHYVVVDFNGFRNMVDAIGGVEVCIPETIDDRAHGIYLEAGTREIEGKEALAYVRQRYAVGNGSDIGRMKRQQAFVASMAAKVVTARTLADPVRLFRFLDAATESLRVDPGLKDVPKIASLGSQFQGIGLSNIQFLTIPWQWDPQDPNRVVWAPKANAVWKKIANDEPLPARLTSDAISAAKPTTTNGSAQGKKQKQKQSQKSQQRAAEREQALADAGLCG